VLIAPPVREAPTRAPKLLLRANCEAELALCCATVAVTGQRAARARELLSGEQIDWEALGGFAAHHGILPLVYKSLTSALGGAMPVDAAQRLRRQFQVNGLRNLSLARELVRLTALLEKAGIQTIAFKGPALAVLAYGSLNLRQFVDLDLLVRAHQVANTIEVLRAEGYVAPTGYGVGEIERPGAFETSMIKPGSLITIDLHWRLAEPYFPLAIHSDDLWRRAMRVEIEGGAVGTLAFDDHLLYLCAHGARHGWETLGGVCDVARLMRAAPIDWDQLCARAERVGAHRMLLLGLLLANDLLDAQVPARVLAAARRARSVVRAARTFINYAADPAASRPGLYQRWSIPLRMIERPGARMRYLAARAFLPSADDRGLVRLPPALRPLYYVLRPLRIALKEGGAALRRLRPSATPPADHPVR
jgi:hypothetical protein